jgi:hypothetical protein
MKLAEALSLRSDLQKRIMGIREQLRDSVRVQEGDEPVVSPADLFAELDACLVEFESLIYRINATNMRPFSDGVTLTSLIAKRDVLTMRVSSLREVLKQSMERAERYSHQEIRYVSTIDVPSLRREVASYSRSLRELDLKIQGINWSVELVEV